jgi:hypothetical protein
MRTRRRLLQAVAGVGLVGGGVYAGRNGLLSDVPGTDALGEPMGVGDTYEHNGLVIQPTDVKETDKLVVVLEPNDLGSGQQRKQITASDSGTLIAVELSVQNTAIEEKTAPAWDVRNYKRMRTDNDSISFGGVNDIRLFADDNGGALPGSRWLQFSVHHFAIDDESLPPYPTEDGGADVAADDELTGWIYGEIVDEGTPRLKMTLGSDDVWWDLE